MVIDLFIVSNCFPNFQSIISFKLKKLDLGFLFKRSLFNINLLQYMWRIGERGVMEGYPAPIIHLWRELPQNLTHVDAVYERLDKKIVFFIGNTFWNGLSFILFM